MIAKEIYEREIVRMWDSLRDDRFKGCDDCVGVICKVCPIYDAEYDNCHLYNDVYNAVERWTSNHPLKKFKVSKLEYDIIRAAIDYSSEEEAFKDVDILYELLINGYFQGATRDMTINYYFDNCEVMEDDTDKR